MIAYHRSIPLTVSVLVVWSALGATEPSPAQEKKQAPKLEEISMFTPELWGLRCFPDGSGNLSWAASPNGVHSTYFKPGTLDFQALAVRIKGLAKEAKQVVKDDKVIAADPDVKPGTCNGVLLRYPDDHYESWAFPQDARGANQLLREVFTAATQAKATSMRGKEFDQVWRTKPPAFMPR
jgi:hypothetical protein